MGLEEFFLNIQEKVKKWLDPLKSSDIWKNNSGFRGTMTEKNKVILIICCTLHKPAPFNVLSVLFYQSSDPERLSEV